MICALFYMDGIKIYSKKYRLKILTWEFCPQPYWKQGPWFNHGEKSRTSHVTCSCHWPKLCSHSFQVSRLRNEEDAEKTLVFALNTGWAKKVHRGFSMREAGKTWMNFLANPMRAWSLSFPRHQQRLQLWNLLPDEVHCLQAKRGGCHSWSSLLPGNQTQRLRTSQASVGEAINQKASGGVRPGQIADGIRVTNGEWAVYVDFGSSWGKNVSI